MNAPRRSMISLCLASCVLLAPTPSHEAPAATTTTAASTKEARIRELMRITGVANLGQQMMTSMIGSLRQTAPNVPDEFWKRMAAEAKVDDLIDLVIPIYSSHFTLDEINQLIDFYSTPIGKKAITEMPGVMQECMAAGQKWGEALGMKIGAQMEKEGYKRN